jgi:hypothetical protein
VAAENIDSTLNGTGLFNTKIPGLSDAADIQAALRLYHYGSYTYDGANTNVANLNIPSMAKHLQNFADADAAEITNRNAAIAAHNADTTDVHGIANTALLATQSFVTTAVTNAINGATGAYSQLAGNGLDWDGVDSQFDVEPSILNLGTVITKSSAFTLELEDVSKTILLNTSSPMALTVPANSVVSIPVGYQYNLIEIGTGRTTFSPSAGVAINSKNGQMYIDSRYGKATLLKIDTDSWIAYGDIYEGVAATTTAATTTTVATTTTAAPPFFPPFFPPSFTTPTTLTTQGTTLTTQGTTLTTQGTTLTTQGTTITTGTTPAPASGYFASFCSNGIAMSDGGSQYTSVGALEAWINANYENVTSVTYLQGSTPALPNCQTTSTTTAAPGTTYYGCCSNGLGVSGTYASSGAAVTGLQAQCAADEPGNNLSGGVFTTQQSCNSGTTSTTTTAAPSLTTYYACCSNGDGVSGSYASSGAAVTGLNAQCNSNEPGIGNTTVGGVFTTPQSCNSATTSTTTVGTTTTAAPTSSTTPAPTTTTTTTAAPAVSRYRASFCGDGSPQQWMSSVSCADAFTQASGNFSVITNWNCQFGTTFPPAPNCTATTTTAAPTTTTAAPTTTTAAPTTTTAATTTTPAPTTTTTTVSPCAPSNVYLFNQGQCTSCGYYWSPTFGECSTTPWSTTAAPPFFPPFFPTFTTAPATTTTAAPPFFPPSFTTAPATTTTSAPATTTTSAPATTTTSAPSSGRSCTSANISMGVCTGGGCDNSGCATGGACSNAQNFAGSGC